MLVLQHLSLRRKRALKLSPAERTKPLLMGFSLRKLRSVFISYIRANYYISKTYYYVNKSSKIKLVEELADILKNNASILFVDFSALNMGEIIALKKDLKEGIKFKALKNLF